MRSEGLPGRRTHGPRRVALLRGEGDPGALRVAPDDVRSEEQRHLQGLAGAHLHGLLEGEAQARGALPARLPQGPALARIVVEGAGGGPDLPVLTAPRGVRRRAGPSCGGRLLSAPRELHAGQDEVTVGSVGEGAAPVREQRHLDPGDPRELARVEADDVLVLRGAGRTALDHAVLREVQLVPFDAVRAEESRTDEAAEAVHGALALLHVRPARLLLHAGAPAPRRLELRASGLQRSRGEFGHVVEERPRAPARLPRLVDRVEEGGERVVLRLGERVVFVVVALGAVEGQAEPDRAHGVDAIPDVVHAGLLGVAPALAVVHVVAMEARGEHRVRVVRSEDVARELQLGEAVERHVLAEGAHDPVAPGPVLTDRVLLEAVGVGVARRVEPPVGEALGVGRGGEHLLDPPLEGGVVPGGRDLFGRRGQAAQVEAEAAGERRARGRPRRHDPLGLQHARDERVDGVGRSIREGRLAGRREGPVRLPGRSCLDPAAEQGLLLLVQRSDVGVRRRHPLELELAPDPRPRLARLDVARDEGRVRTLGGVEAELRLARGLVGTMAGEAALREEGPDLAREVGRRRGLGEDHRSEHGPSVGDGAAAGPWLSRARLAAVPDVPGRVRSSPRRAAAGAPTGSRRVSTLRT